MEDQEKRGPGRPPKAEQVEQPSEMKELLAMVMEQNRLLIEQMGKQNTESTIALAAELRKPTEMEQKKLDEEKAKTLKQIEMSVNATKEKDIQDKRKRDGCPHEDGNGITCFNGQVTTGGRWAVFCNRCGTPCPPIKATDSERLNGIGLRTWKNVTLAGLDQLYRQREGLSSTPTAAMEPELAAV